MIYIRGAGLFIFTANLCRTIGGAFGTRFNVRNVASSCVYGEVTVPDVEITIEVNNTYQVVTTALTQNVVAMVEGSDPNLRNTYVFFGAHLDHVGYSSGTETQGRVNTPLDQDRIWNGADDDGSGSVALLALAKAFQNGPRPKRSVVFVWHAAEEEGMLGSEFMAAHPVVPLESIQAQLNIDMIGRNREDRKSTRL